MQASPKGRDEPVLVVGSLAFDTIGVVERLPGANATSRVHTLARLPGGAAGNVAAALARLGARARLLSAVGSDFRGSPYERALSGAGVDLSLVVEAEDETAHAYVFGDAEGNQTTFFHPGASRALPRAPVTEAALGHFAAGEISDYPRRMGACRLATFDPGQECFHRDLAEIKACLPHADYVFLNRHELARLLDAWRWTIDDFFAEGAGALVETLGAEGCRLHTPEGDARVPGVPARVADATGAGDAHRAGFLFALARGATPVEALRLGAVVASFVVEAVGPQGGLPTLEAALERHRKAYGTPPACLARA